MTQQPRQPSRIVDMQLPLPWLITSAALILSAMVGMVWSVAGQSNKLDQLLLSTTKLEKRVDERDTRLDLLKENQYEGRRSQDALSLRVDAIEREMRK